MVAEMPDDLHGTWKAELAGTVDTAPRCTQAWILPAALAWGPGHPPYCRESLGLNAQSSACRDHLGANNHCCRETLFFPSSLPSFPQHIETKPHSSSHGSGHSARSPPGAQQAWPGWCATPRGGALLLGMAHL